MLSHISYLPPRPAGPKTGGGAGRSLTALALEEAGTLIQGGEQTDIPVSYVGSHSQPQPGRFICY